SSNVQVFLVGAPTLNLKVRLAAAGRSVFQVVLSLPEQSQAMSAARRALERERVEMQSEYEALRSQFELQVADRAFTQVLDGMLQRFECRELEQRSMRDYLIFQTHSICRIGRYVYILFTIKNRRRSSVFHFAELLVTEAGQDPSVGSLDVNVRFEVPSPAVPFDEKVKGIAAFLLPDEGRQFGPWKLTLVEDGGANRRVRVDAIGF
ncbi:MAG: hypothetical protein AAFV29_21575, partial [Myxococcota bacterium]